MKKIKLSGKLLMALLLIIVGVVAYQAFISSKVNNDKRRVQNKQSVKELLSSLEESKTFKHVECAPFSNITINDAVSVQIMKGDKYEVFYSGDYNFEIITHGDQLKIGKKGVLKSGATDNGSVYVFLPEDPKVIAINRSYFSNGNWSIFGFDGTNTLLNVDIWHANLITDMHKFTINTKNSNVYLKAGALDTSVVVEQMKLSVDADSSSFFLDKESKLKKIDVDICLRDGNFNLNLLESKTQAGNIKIQGSVFGEPVNKYRPKNESLLNISHCDSLSIVLGCKGEGMHQLKFSDQLQANYEDIQCSSNINVVRKNH